MNLKIEKNWIKILQWPIAVLALHAINTYFGLYWVWLRLDNLMHFLGGAAVAVAFLELLAVLGVKFSGKKTGLDPRSESGMTEQSNGLAGRIFIILFTVSIVALTAVLWEFMEYGLDYFFGLVMQPNVTDTMSDLALGLLGSLVAATLQIKKQ